MLISYLTYKFCIRKPCYCTRWFACYDYPGEGHTPLYDLIRPIRGCAAGQSTVREQNLDTLY